MEKLGAKREDKVKTRKESEVARKYFSNLFRDSNEGKRTVEGVDLEGVNAPGVAGGYEAGTMI